VQIVGWATWCHGCLSEIPRLKEVYGRHRAEGFEILAITGPIGQNLSQVKSFVRRMALPYPVLYDEGTRVLREYRINFVPYICIVDRKGRIVYEGSHLPSDDEKRIETLLATDSRA